MLFDMSANKQFQCFVPFVCTLALFVFMIFAVVAPAHAARGKENNKYAAMVIDSETGQVLFERNGDKAVYPASLTKVMTLLLLFEALEAGQVRLNDRIPVSAHAAAAPPSKLGLRVGSTIKVKDAIYAMVTKSANDVAVAVGEFLGGSEARFAQIMTSRARQLGMRGTTFRNASGLHNPAQTTTARDMIVLARTVIRQYPDYYRYFSTQNFTYNGHSYNNHNRLMGKYPGMDGMKTGYVNASGFNLVASAVRDDKRLIAVVFGGRTANSRNAEMRKILDASFARINQTSSGIRVASASETFAPKPVVRDVVDAEDMPNMAMVEHSAGQKQGALNPMIGQGDFDPGMVRRMNAGLLAIAAHQGMQKQNPVVRPAQRQTQRSLVTPVVSSASARGSKDWSIQIGAFNSRVASEESTARALGKLPAVLRHGQPAVAPMKTNKGWLYRARLSGYTQAQANVACRYLRDCIPVAPIR